MQRSALVLFSSYPVKLVSALHKTLMSEMLKSKMSSEFTQDESPQFLYKMKDTL